MSDAEPSAATGEAMPIAGHPYTLACRLHGGGIGWIALARKPSVDGKLFQQRCYRLQGLMRNFPGRDAVGDWYLSLNAFKRPRRTLDALVSLRGNFVDCDTYTVPRWANEAPDAVWQAMRARLAALGIPLPQVVIFSGRGLQLIWVYPKGLPAAVLPRWRAVQKGIGAALKAFGPDFGALDATRLVRLPGTVNSKSGLSASFLHLDLDGATEFETFAGAVLAHDRFALRAGRRRRASGAARRGSPRRAALARFNETILADLRRLIDHRWGGRIPLHHRNTTLFIYGCFLVRVTGIVALPSALLTFGTSVCDLPDDEMEQIAASITSKIAADGIGYRFSVASAADRLGITAEEARAARLVRLHPADPALATARQENRRLRDRERKRLVRLSTGARPRALSLTRTQPWAAEGVSRSTWYRQAKHRNIQIIPSETKTSSATNGYNPSTFDNISKCDGYDEA